MKRSKITSTTLLLLSLLQIPAYCAPPGQSPQSPQSANSRTNMKRAVPNQVIVVPKQGLDSEDLKTSLNNIHGTVIDTTTSDGLTCYLVQIEPASFEQGFNQLKKDKNFTSVQRNLRSRRKRNSKPFVGTPDDPEFSQQYQFAQLNVIEAWKEGANGRIRVGIIDDGVRGTQADLEPRVERGFNVPLNRPGGDTPDDKHSHGTFVATCFGATTNNRLLGASPAYESQIVPVNVFNNGQENVEDSDDFTYIKAINWLLSQKIKLANLSINGDDPDYFSNQQAHPVLFAAFVNYHKNGGLLFNAAGNESTYDPNPRTRNLIVIAGTNSRSGHYSGTNFGKSVWFAAPGEDVPSSNIFSRVEISDGTSFASPLACSIAALIWSANPSLTNDEVLEIMRKTATRPPGYTPDYYGYGIPNAAAAVKMARE
jgi:subtilisin family serine protease